MTYLCCRLELDLKVGCLHVLSKVEFFNERELFHLAKLFDPFDVTLSLMISFTDHTTSIISVCNLHLEAIGTFLQDVLLKVIVLLLLVHHPTRLSRLRLVDHV